MGMRGLASLKNVGQQLPDENTHRQPRICNIQKPESITERVYRNILICPRLKKIMGLNLVKLKPISKRNCVVEYVAQIGTISKSTL